MKTQIFAKTESELLPYLPAYKAIMSATGFMGVEVDKNTGVMQEVVKPFSAEQKLVWLYALDRYRFFSKENKEWFDNQIEIAEACNVSESCVKKFFRALREANVIRSKGTRIGGHNSNSYIILKDLVLVQRENTAQKTPTSPLGERSTSTDTNVAPPVKEPVKPLEEIVEDEEDFDSMIEIASDNYDIYSEPVEQKPVCPFATAPTKRFKPNGSVSEEMEFWCNRNQVIITNVNGQTLFKYKAKRFIIEAGAFVEYVAPPYVSSAPKTLAEASGMSHMLQSYYNNETDLPF